MMRDEGSYRIACCLVLGMRLGMRLNICSVVFGVWNSSGWFSEGRTHD